MARMQHRRSLTNVRTHTTRRSSPALAKHELYMKLTSLEIERSRRASDRQATLDRVRLIEERLEAITAEQAAIRQLLDQDETVATPLPSVAPRSQPNHSMNLRY